MSRFDMSLDKALSILARVHTRDNAFSGFVVESTARPDWSNGVTEGEYAEAWGTVREHLHLQTEPQSSDVRVK